MATFGFIGIGSMGGAIAAAAAKAHDPADIWVSAGHPERAAAFAREHGMVASTNEEIARECKFVVLGVILAGIIMATVSSLGLHIFGL